MKLRVLLAIFCVSACFPASASNFTRLPRDVKLYLLGMVDPESRSALAMTSTGWYDLVNRGQLAATLGIGRWVAGDFTTLTTEVDRDFTDEEMAKAVAFFIARGPVHATAGDFRVIDLIVRQGAVIPPENRDALLEVALERGYFDMVLGMMFVGQLSDQQRLNAIVRAAGSAPLHTLQLFLSNEFNVPQDVKRRATEEAALKGNLPVLKFLLGNDELSQEQRENLVRFAALGESVEVIQFLLASGPISERCRVQASESAYSGNHQWAILAEICDSGPLSARQLGELLWSAIVFDEDRVVLALARNNDLKNVLSSTRYEINRDFPLRVCLGRKVLVEVLLNNNLISQDTLAKALKELNSSSHPEIARLLVNALSDDHRGIAIAECIKRDFFDIFQERIKGKLNAWDLDIVLQAAAEKGDIQVFRTLLSTIRFSNAELLFALSIAIKNNHEELLKLLVERHAFGDGLGECLAKAQYYNTGSVKFVLQKTGHRLSKSARGKLALEFAEKGFDELVSAVIATGKVSWYHLSCIRDVYIKRNAWSMPPELLRQKRVDVKHKEWVINNAENYRIDALKALSRNPHFTPSDREEAVLKLAKRRCHDCVKVLIDGGDISTDTLGRAICQALEEYDDRLVKILLSAGTYLVEPYRGKALKIARNRYDQEIYQLLQAHPNGWFSANMVGIVGFGILVALVCLEGKGSN